MKEKVDIVIDTDVRRRRERLINMIMNTNPRTQTTAPTRERTSETRAKGRPSKNPRGLQLAIPFLLHSPFLSLSIYLSNGCVCKMGMWRGEEEGREGGCNANVSGSLLIEGTR